MSDPHSVPKEGPPPPQVPSTQQIALETGPFVLRTLLADIPLSADGGKEDIRINCVDYLDRNLYVGTSASELLHFVQIPPDPQDKSGSSVFILASRLRPPYAEPTNVPHASLPGVQQILLLPRVGKACILCNWTATFYSLPELSPVFNNRQVKNCNWIGGVDLNESGPEHGGEHRSPGVTILLSLNRRIWVTDIGDDARLVKKIDFAGSNLTVRRDTIACVADARSYSLLDVDRQLKIPLMNVSSLDDSQPGAMLGQAQNIAGSGDSGLLRSASSAQSRPLLAPNESAGHTRSTSLSGFISGNNRKQVKGASEAEEPVFQEPDANPPPVSRSPAPPEPSSSDRPALDKLPSTAPNEHAKATTGQGLTAKSSPVLLKPHILSPSAEEFLLVTGTGPLDPGIGMFVNLDGDPTRPTVEFERYPREVVVDGGQSDLSASRPSFDSDEEGYVLASMARELGDGIHHGLEIQRWDLNVGEGGAKKFWLEVELPGSEKKGVSTPLGIRSLLNADETSFQDVVDKLCQRRFAPFPSRTPVASTPSLRSVDSRTALSMEMLAKEKELFDRELDSDDDPLPEGWVAKRNAEEEEFAKQLAKATTRLAVWAGSHIWWAVRNPLILQLDATLEQHVQDGQPSLVSAEERRHLIALFESFQGRDAKTELEFMTFNYIRQRAGVLLLAGLLLSENAPAGEAEVQITEKVLLEGGLDPRVVIALIPALRNEIVESRKGIWIYGGVKRSVEAFVTKDGFAQLGRGVGALQPTTLQFFRRFLTAWRSRKGLASIADESEVFRTVDAALLLVLLELDRNSAKGLGRTGSIRQELYDLVDHGVDCFDRAVDLLETYHRLFVLSRLYQSRKMSADVLATWKRIVEGEQDDGGELKDGEQRVREYLGKISSQALVQEYGIWLANRNPKLGVQVFADNKGRAPKFQPEQVVALLRAEAPDAVKYYLEYLVFGKGHTAYVSELITYYLDIVVEDLRSSAESRSNITASYEAYRALRPPKPTYHQFLTDNAPSDDEVWQSRLRLLQLLGGAHEYDATAIRARIASALPADTDEHPDRQLLVPETIILDGRERRHEDALRLLVHRLGDYDTAASYCLRGGPSSIYYTPTPGRRESDSLPSADAQARLFRALLREFLALGDAADRIEQTGALLERFGAWFDVREVLELLPDGWSLDAVAGFLVAALRRLVAERHESMVARALSSAENLGVNYDLLKRIDEKGPVVEAGK